MPAWPLVRNALVTTLPGLPGWSTVTVYNGQQVTADAPADFVTVGYVPGEDFAGSYEQTRPAGWGTEETGTIRSQLVSQDGDADLAANEARAFALVDAWESWLTADPTMGVLEQGSTASLSVDVEPVQNTAGSAARLIVTVSYLARY